jgi:hypothetical protein
MWSPSIYEDKAVLPISYLTLLLLLSPSHPTPQMLVAPAIANYFYLLILSPI